MKTLNRNAGIVFATLLLLSTYAPDLFAQQPIVFFQYRHVPQENIAEFVDLETTYWAEVARKAIEEGKMSTWELWQKTSGWNLDDGSNFLFVNVYPNKEQLDASDVWNLDAVFPNVRAASISTGRLSTLKHNMFLLGEVWEEKEPAQYVRINYAKASDVDRYVELEQTIWRPFIMEQMEKGTTDVTSWGVARVLVPNGASIPFNAITVDGFQTFSGSVQATWDEGVEIPDLTPFEEVASGFDRVVTYALVKRVTGGM